MALQKNIYYRGLSIENAYISINAPRIKDDKKTLSFGVRYMADKDQPDEIYSEQFECEYDLNGGNPFVQAYSYLKTLPSFLDAITIDD